MLSEQPNHVEPLLGDQQRAAVTLDDYVRELAWAPDGRSLYASLYRKFIRASEE